MMGVDPAFKSLVKDIKKRKPDLSDREITRELANEITGKRLFKRKKNGIVFNI